MRTALSFIISFFCGISHASGIGMITLENGQSFSILQLGVDVARPDYFIRADKQFISIKRVRQIARVGVGLVHVPMFEIFLDDGTRVHAEVGTMWYQRSALRDSVTGVARYSYSAVMKERGSSGLLLTIEVDGDPREIELADPNAFLDFVIEPTAGET